MALVQPRLATLVGCLVLVLAAIAVFGAVPSFHGAIMDDGRNLVFNPRVGSLDAKDLGWALVPHTDYAPRYIPLGWILADVETAALGYDPAILREANLALHIANTILLLLLLRRLLIRAGQPDSLRTVLAACLGAAAYGLHPLRSEMVGWATTLFWQEGLFWLLLAGFARTASRPRPILEAFCYAASLLSYPVALGLAPGLFALDALRSGWKQSLRANGLLLAIALLDGGITYHLASAGSPGSASSFPLSTRLEQVLAVEGRGLGLWLWPTHLTPYAKPLEQLQAHDWVEVGGAIALVAAIVAGASLRRLRPLLGWSLLFAAAVAPFTWATSWQDPDIPDRYFALSSLVLCAALAWGVALRPVFWLPLISLAVACWAYMARQGIQIWRDETALYTRAIAELDSRQPDFREHRAFFEFHLAIESFNAGSYGAAEKQILGTVADDPRTPQYGRALQEIDRRFLATKQPVNSPSVPVLQHRNLAEQAFDDNEPAKAEHHLDEIRRLDPDYYAALTKAPAARLPAGPERLH